MRSKNCYKILVIRKALGSWIARTRGEQDSNSEDSDGFPYCSDSEQEYSDSEYSDSDYSDSDGFPYCSNSDDSDSEYPDTNSNRTSDDFITDDTADIL